MAIKKNQTRQTPSPNNPRRQPRPTLETLCWRPPPFIFSAFSQLQNLRGRRAQGHSIQHNVRPKYYNVGLLGQQIYPLQAQCPGTSIPHPQRPQPNQPPPCPYQQSHPQQHLPPHGHPQGPSDQPPPTQLHSERLHPSDSKPQPGYPTEPASAVTDGCGGKKNPLSRLFRKGHAARPPRRKLRTTGQGTKILGGAAGATVDAVAAHLIEKKLRD